MADFPKLSSSLIREVPGVVPENKGEMAGPAEIPRPDSRSLSHEELSAQQYQRKRPDFSALPRTLAEAAALGRELETKGKKIEGSQGALMDFLKKGPGDGLSADLLAASATLMGAAALKKPRRSRRWKAARLWQKAHEGVLRSLGRILFLLKSKSKK